MSSPALARIQLLAAAALFSTGGAAIKATALDAWQVAGFRSGVAALVLALLLPASRRIFRWKILLVAVAYAATLILFVTANKLTTAANTIFLQSTAPLYILLLGPFLLHERIRRSDLVFMGVVAVGMALFFVGTEEPVATAPNPALGNVLAAAAGVTWALTVMGLRWLGREEGENAALPTVVAGNVVAFLACLPWALPVTEAAAVDWLVIGYLGAVQIGLAYLLLITGIRHVPALEASVLLLLEPALNPAWAWALLGERPSSWALVGGAIILLATLVRTWRDGRQRALAAAPRAGPPSGRSPPIG
jgi:drug/metabolite transporter, DME family